MLSINLNEYTVLLVFLSAVFGVIGFIGRFIWKVGSKITDSFEDLTDNTAAIRKLTTAVEKLTHDYETLESEVRRLGRPGGKRHYDPPRSRRRNT